jgi:cell fate regulator YaaT (PSP1 superfamily)
VVAPNARQYLVSYGSSGEFGRFQAVPPVECSRGDQVVVQGRRGLELGVILCEATAAHARLLKDSPTGQLLRRADPEDRRAAASARERGQLVFQDSRRLAIDLELPLEILDVEVSLDGRQAVVQFLAPAEVAIDGLASTLARRHDLYLLMHNLAAPAAEDAGGCGEPNCGRAAGGHCSTCGSGGGCATGCGSGVAPDMAAYFAHLRTKMEQRNFTSLL